MAKIQLPIYYQDGSDERKLRCVVDAWTFQDNAMGERYITFDISSYQPIFFAIGDYCIYRGETYTLNYRPSETQSAKIGEHGEAFTYEKVKFESFGEELTRCTMLDITPTTGDYIAYEGTNYTGSAVFSLFCGEATVTLQGRTFTMTAVSVLAGKIQANLDRMFPRAGWRVLVDYEHTHTDDFHLTLDNWTVAQALSEVYNTFKLNYIVKGREIRIGFAADNVTGEELFAFGFGRGYPTTEHDGKGLFEIKKTSDSNQKIVTRLRALGSTKNMPYRYYNKKYNLPQAMFPLNLQLPDTFETPEVKAAHNAQREESLRDVLGDTNDAYIDKNDNAAECAEGIREDVARWDGSDGNLKEIFPTIKEGTYRDLRNANVPDYGGRTGSSSYPNYNPTERVDEVLAVGYSNGGIWIDDVNTGDGILPETIADGKEKKIQSAQIPLTAVQSSSLISEGDYLLGPETSLCTIRNQQPGAYILVSNHLFFYAYYNAGGTIFSSSAIDAGYRLSIKISGKQPLVFNKTEEITHLGTFFKEQLQRIPDVEKGQDAQIEKIVLDSVSDVEVTIRPIFKTLPSTAGTYTVSFQLRDDEGKNDDPYFVWSPDETNWGTVGQQFHLYIKDIGFDINDYWGGDTPKLVMASGVCVSKAFEISEVNPVTYSRGGQTLECYCLTLNRDSDDSLHAYFPSENYPIHVSDQFVLEGIEMPDVYVELAELRLLRAATDYLADNCETNFIYKPSLNDIYLQWNYDKMVAAGTREKSIYWRLYAGLKFTFRGIPESTDPSVALPIAEITIESVTIREGVATTPQVEITLNKNIQQNTIQKLTTAVDRIYSTMSNGTGGTGAGASNAMLLSLLKSEGAKLFLSKKEADAAQGFIQFLQGMGVGSSGMGISRDGAARLLSVVLNGGYGIDAGGKATLADVVARLITATGLVSPDYGGDDLVGGSGFKMEYDALTGRSSVFTDFLTVRMKAIFAALEIRKVTYSSGTLVVSGAGSEAYKVAPVGADGASPFIPAEYEALEYLEKVGNAGYFITPYLPNERTRIEAEVMFPDELGSGFTTLWCSRTSTAHTIEAPSFTLWRNETNGNLRLDWRDARNNSSVAVVRGVRTTVVAENGLLTFTDVNGSTSTIGAQREDEWTAPYALKIWETVDGNASSTSNHGRGRIYRFKIYEGDVLMHDYQPARRVSDGHLGLYDLAADSFLENNGATDTSITAGEVIQTAETQANEHFKAHWREVEEADTYAHRIYCVADDGTTATMNDWHVGDQVLCQTFNIDDASLVHTNLSNRYWWRLALRTGTEVLDDGKQYTWVEVASSQQNLQITLQMMQAYAVYADLYAAYQAMSEKPSFFEAYATVFPRYDGGGEGEVTACDVPEEGDTMAQVGSQTDTARQGLAMVRAEGLDSGFYIYTPVTRFTLRDTLVTKITPRGTVMSSQFFRIVSSADVGNPKPLTVFRGEWSASKAYAYYDEVTYGGERWACVNAAGVAAGGNPPSRTNSDWLLTVAKGNDGEAGVVRWMEVSLQSVRVRKDNGHYFLTESPGSSDVLTVTLYEQRGGVTEKVRDDNYLYIGGYVNQINPILGAFGIDEYVSIDQYLIWDATNERYTSDSAGFPVGLNFDELMFRWTDTGGNVYAEHKVLLSVDGEKGDKGDKGDAGVAFTLSPPNCIVTEVYDFDNDQTYYTVNGKARVTGDFDATQVVFHKGGTTYDAKITAVSVSPTTSPAIISTAAAVLNRGAVRVLLSGVSASANIDVNQVEVTLTVQSPTGVTPVVSETIKFNLYINHIGTTISKTRGDYTQTIRERTGWAYDDEGNPTLVAYKSQLDDAADRFSRELSAVPVSRNILLNTDFVEHRQGGGVREMHVVSTAANQGYKHIRTDNVLAYGTAYRLSFYARGTGNVRAYFYVQSNGSTVLTRYINAQAVTDNLQRFSLTITTPSDNIEGYGFELRLMSAATGADIYISRMQLEQGSTVTYWSPTEAKNLLLNSDLAQVDENYAPVYWEAHDGSGTPTKRELTMAVAPWWVSWNDRQYEGFMLTRQEVNAENMELWQSAHITPNTDRPQSEETAYQGIAQYGSVIGERPLKHAKYYAVSFYAKGTGTTDLIFHLFNEGVNVNIGGWIGNSFSLTTSWKRYTWAFCALPELATNYDSGYGFKLMLGCYHAYDVMPAGEDMYISRVQLEEVTEAQYNAWYADHSTEIATEWRRGEENTGVQSSRYEQTAERIDMAVYKDEAEVVGMHMDGANSHLDFVANKTGFFGTDGKEYIKWGVKDGIPYLIFLDGDGVERYNLGFTGLRQILQNSEPQSWDSMVLYGYYVSEATYNAKDIWEDFENYSQLSPPAPNRRVCHQYNSAWLIDGSGTKQYSDAADHGKIFLTDDVDGNYFPTGSKATGWMTSLNERINATNRSYSLYYINNGEIVLTRTILIEKVVTATDTFYYAKYSDQTGVIGETITIPATPS